MDITVFSTKSYDRRFMDAASGGNHKLVYLEALLSPKTSVQASGARAVCAFANDQVNEKVLIEFKRLGVGLVALRGAGYNNVDLVAAKQCGIIIAHVPAYSPEAISEHTVALILSLDRNIHRAYARVRDGNFALDGLIGFNLHGRTVGIVGTGRIGTGVARILRGFGCKLVGHDPAPNPVCTELGLRYLPLSDLLAAADIVTLHCPLTEQTQHLINDAAIAQMKRGAMLINTSRGGVIDTSAVIEGLKSGTIGHLGLDVYEGEAPLFFDNRSDEMILDDVFERLLTFPNVLVTGHQAFFTTEALTAIAETTIANINSFGKTGRAVHEVN